MTAGQAIIEERGKATYRAECERCGARRSGQWTGGDPACDHSQAASRTVGNAPSLKSTLTTNNGAGPRPGDKFHADQRREVATECPCGARWTTSQLGLEATPDEYVARMVDVFREVRRVLRDDGTVWLNLGDSYNGYMANQRGTSLSGRNQQARPVFESGHGRRTSEAKAKDLLGIPWMVAFALRAPYYAGRIKDERERLWLAAMIDTEGSIGINWQRSGVHRPNDIYSVSVKVHNTSKRLIERCAEIAGVGSVAIAESRNQTVYVWSVYGANAREVLREVYPHFVAKQQEARLAYANDECVSAQARQRYEALRLLHAGSDTTVDAPPPPDCLEPGWYLRSDVIWAKPNPMPESVTDRPTSAHEHVFLLTKSARYAYDADAIREASSPDMQHRALLGHTRGGGGFSRAYAEAQPGHGAMRLERPDVAGRNKRNVWEIATQPYADAHFATFPTKLVEPCLLAGSSPKACGQCGAPWERVVERETSFEGNSARAGRSPDEIAASGKWQAEQLDGNAGLKAGPVVASRTLGWQPSCAHQDDTGRSLVLDPFAGSGTVGVVARWHGRDFIGIELNADYCEMARRRILREGHPGRRGDTIKPIPDQLAMDLD